MRFLRNRSPFNDQRNERHHHLMTMLTLNSGHDGWNTERSARIAKVAGGIGCASTPEYLANYTGYCRRSLPTPNNSEHS